jgi:hypothetical protein
MNGDDNILRVYIPLSDQPVEERCAYIGRVIDAHAIEVKRSSDIHAGSALEKTMPGTAPPGARRL